MAVQTDDPSQSRKKTERGNQQLAQQFSMANPVTESNVHKLMKPKAEHRGWVRMLFIFVAGIKPRPSGMGGKCLTIELHP